ncbi:MAG: HAMP domain-containing histidine kinase [bacterium]|nr:HAMP domain-containing histidine kinase [bacterium]
MERTERRSFFLNIGMKYVLAGCLLVLALGVLGGHLTVSYYCDRQSRMYAMAAARMLDSVKRAYPEVSEQEFFAVLNDGTDSGEGEVLLRRYGVIPEEGLFFAESDRNRLGLRLGLLRCTFFSAALLAVILFLYAGQRREKIRKLCSYMEELSRGNYSLELEENSEDELSGLKNEVYKMTVYLKEQAVRAREGKRALADAMADISHQLKTPLTSVTVLVDNLLENEEMALSVRDRFLREISRQVSGVSWLVAALLKLSRLDAGVVELERQSISVKKLLEEVCGKLELLAELRQVTFRIAVSEEIRIFGDGQWLSEAFLNLVKNALEHSFEGGYVELAAQENDVYTLVTVRDYGEGIGPEEQRHLFERFYRGKSAGADSVGIGLALAKEIIGRQEGYITVESSREKGTAFFVKFLKCH